jgi:hypothetical protein
VGIVGLSSSSSSEEVGVSEVNAGMTEGGSNVIGLAFVERVTNCAQLYLR